jgi:hypothetical protein
MAEWPQPLDRVAGSNLGGITQEVTTVCISTGISDLANPWGYVGSLFLISARSVGKRGNTSTVAGHYILKY